MLKKLTLLSVNLSFYLVTLSLSSLVFAKADLEMANKIRQEGFHNSHAMSTLQYLTDEIGPRLSGSPALREANDWTMQQLSDWGLKNTHLDDYHFGRGWSHQSATIDLVSPRKVTLHGIPVAWTPGTEGTVTGEVVAFNYGATEQLEQYTGKLKGKILLLDDSKEMKEPKKPFSRFTSKELTEKAKYLVSNPASHAERYTPAEKEERIQQIKYKRALSKFIEKEGVQAVIYRSWRQGGLIGVFGGNHREGYTFSTPAMIIEAEHYEKLIRLIELDKKPVVSLNIDAQFHDEDHKGYNTIAEIPGSDANGEIVMAGAHLDSWHASDGAVDNGVGVAVVMEAARILSSLDIKPKRTIRFALWTGEEQGHIGSLAYVDKHFASRPTPKTAFDKSVKPYFRQDKGWPISLKPAHEKLSVYFNMDNGGGRFRGIYTEGNVAVKSTLSDWFSPYKDISEGIISTRSTGGTDHESFDDVGLPGFQFIQDPLDYFPRLWHSHIDSFDHVVEDDVIQASVIMAGMLYEAANAKERMARKPVPMKPSDHIREQQLKAAEKARKKRQTEALKALEVDKI
ncbi:M20/M25/M40 family metallo-hydrolase [Thalassotalea ganghwensis]